MSPRRLTTPIRALSASLLLALVAAGCATNPSTGDNQLLLVSREEAIQMGKEADGQIVQSMGLAGGDALQSYVRDLGSDLASISEEPDLPWTFRVVDNPTVNAFAVPGGFIYVTRGILVHFDSEAQLAAVLGHEIGHVTGRHTRERMSRAQLAQAGLLAGVILAPELRNFAGLASTGLQVLFLKFSRDDERQADDLGLEYMWETGYDPRAMPAVFSLLSRVSQSQGDGGGIPGWLSTHPDPEDRRERIQAAIAELGGTMANRTVARDRFLERVDGLVYGTDPRQGYFRDNVFLHPELEFRLGFPAGWSTTNTAQAVYAVSPEQDGVVSLSLTQASSPEAAAREFFGQEGVQAPAPRSTEVSGFPAVRSEFEATTEQGVLAGRAIFVAYGGRTYRLLGYAPAEAWPGYRSAVRSSLQSFDRLDDPELLDVQPRRIDVVTLSETMSLEEYVRRHGAEATVEELALLNQVQPDARLERGRKIKTVVK